MTDVIAVTALSLLQHHQIRQPMCLDSWLKTGLTICAVQQPHEIDSLKAAYPQVSIWLPSTGITTHYRNNTQRINSLCDAATRLDQTILLINSDIEIYGSQSLLVEAAQCAQDTFTIGIRQNYDVNINLVSRELWGFDAFVLSPSMVATLPRIPIGIGKPTWDYWLPYHFRETQGFKINVIGDPYFFHQSHPLNWTQREWFMGREWLEQHYCGRRFDPNTCHHFRTSLPFSPLY